MCYIAAVYRFEVLQMKGPTWIYRDYVIFTLSYVCMQRVGTYIISKLKYLLQLQCISIQTGNTFIIEIEPAELKCNTLE